jgi:hypothetical protein
VARGLPQALCFVRVLHRARAEAGQHAALRVGEIIRRARAICPADQVTGDTVVVELAGVDPAATVAELL